MSADRSYTISIAGFDPTNGAGITADVKTFEQIGVYGLGVCTAVTVQNENEFKTVEWISLNTITEQLEILIDKYPVQFVKIGLIESFDVLEEVVFFLKKKNPDVKIIWDPILKSSSGFVFHEQVFVKQLKNLLKDIFLITPNREEILKLSPADSPEKAARNLMGLVNIYLKDGHNDGEEAIDRLFFERQEFELKAERSEFSKHGSGCVFSSALVAYLSMGNDVQQACAMAKEYVTRFINSDESLLGWHKQQVVNV